MATQDLTTSGTPDFTGVTIGGIPVQTGNIYGVSWNEVADTYARIGVVIAFPTSQSNELMN